LREILKTRDQRLKQAREQIERLKREKRALEKELEKANSVEAKVRKGAAPANRAEHSTATTPTERPTTSTASESPDPTVGDTLDVESGISITVLSYESPMPPPPFAQLDTDHEYAAIEIEWCTGPNYNGYINRASISYFTLQMPDNTHLRAGSRQAKEPRLSGYSPCAARRLRAWMDHVPNTQRRSTKVHCVLGY
jgi:hypothetical protein